jgi:ABC-type lipoprotein export system ATPase subunit
MASSILVGNSGSGKTTFFNGKNFDINLSKIFTKNAIVVQMINFSQSVRLELSKA